MEGRELDPYEQQLLAVFESCDRNHVGSLDSHGLEQLCEKLQLEEQGMELIQCLLGGLGSEKRVTFPEFRDGLLALLGDDQGDLHSKQREQDRGSPEREVSPKFVFGKKKYGRRSRPESREQDVDADNNESLEDSDLEIFVEVGDKDHEITVRSVPAETSVENIKEKKKIVINSAHSPDFKKESLLFRRRSSERGHMNATKPLKGKSGLLEQADHIAGDVREISSSLQRVNEVNLSVVQDNAQTEELQDNLNSQVWQNSPEVGGIYNDEGNLPSLGQVGDNEEECLRAAWDRLGVGKDGFLDRRELALVCECIGMEKVAEEVVQQLFEKLDVDRDGRISFEEFLLLFRSGGSWVPSNAVEEVVQEKREAGGIGTFPQTSKKANELQTLVPSSDQTPQFLALSPNSAGFVSAELVVEMWEAAGIRRPLQLLQDLGFSAQRVNMAELAVVLEEELNTLNEENRTEVPSEAAALLTSPRETLLQAMLALYQAEVRCLKMSLEHMSAERDKLRADILDANQRATLLAQEIDDHHARLEKSSQLQVRLLEQRHSEQLRELTEQLSADREQLAVQNMALEKQVLNLQEEELRLRTQVATLQSENELLEKENHNIMEQLAKAEEAKKELQKEIESLAGLQQRLSELEGNRDQEEVLPLIEKLNELQAENTGLRDRNDELTMEVEALTAKLAAIRTKRVPILHPGHDAMDSESASEEVGTSSGCSAIKRRSEFPPILPPEDSSEEESPRLGKMRRCCENDSGDIQDTSLEGLQILGHGESGVEADLALDDSEGANTDSSFVGEEKLRDQHCSHWLDKDKQLVSSHKEETDEVAMLRSRIAKLEQELNQQKTDKLLVYDSARLQVKENACQHCGSRDESDAPVPTKQVKGQLKQVFEVIRKQAMQDLLEDKARLSSLKEQWRKDNQRNQGTDTSGLSSESSKVTNYPFTDSLDFGIPIPTNGMVFYPSGNTKKLINIQEDCRDLGSQLDLIKIEILNILSERKACSKENCALKNHISELKNKLDNQCLLSDTDNKYVPAQEVISVSRDSTDKSEVVVKVNKEHGSESINAFHVTKASGDVYSMEVNSEINEKSGDVSKDINEEINKLEEDNVASKVDNLHQKLKEQERIHRKEISDLQERCGELESSLELLRQEYEKCEDYWANKLEEERHLFDQEQKMSDEKFSELMSKIKEYEELFGAQDNRSDDSDRLSTIEERASLEKQFTDLEEEFEEFRVKMEQEQNEREEEIMRLREQLRALEIQQKHSESKLNVAVQVTDLENGSWESDRTFVVELEGARKAITSEISTAKSMNNSPSVVMNGYKRNNTDRKILASSRSSTPVSSQSTDTDSTELRTEVCRLRNLKDRLNDECHALKEQKEQLVQEVLNIQTGKSYSTNGIGKTFPLPHANRSASQACRIDLNVLQALNSRLKQQEQECRHLQLTLKQQQQQNDSIIKRANQKHEEELSELKLQLQKTEEQLQHQTTTCKDQMERLARTDILVKELYVENAYLMATLQNLEQRCQVLGQMTSDSSSV